MDSGFDAAYTYFASDGFTYGSTISNWPTMARFAATHHLLFIPSVGPGYDDSKIRPWNKRNSKARMGGRYYEQMWSAAMGAGATLVSITSYNEWGEGTQIEPALPKSVPHDGALPQAVRNQLEASSPLCFILFYFILFYFIWTVQPQKRLPLPTPCPPGRGAEGGCSGGGRQMGLILLQSPNAEKLEGEKAGKDTKASACLEACTSLGFRVSGLGSGERVS